MLSTWQRLQGKCVRAKPTARALVSDSVDLCTHDEFQRDYEQNRNMDPTGSKNVYVCCGGAVGMTEA